MKIGKLSVKNKIFLAPMEEINDIAFRLLCKKAGAGMTYTPMIHPLTQQKLYLDDKPVLQIFCSDEVGVRDFIKKYDSKVSGWDLNLGCPAKTARKHKFGAFLHGNLESIEKILSTMKKSTKKNISIKIRKSENTKKIIKIANKYCDAICIHPRTKEQGYSGNPDLKFAESLRKITKLPLIYSGNVDEKNYNALLKKFDAVMIGRRAVGDPNIFSILNNKKNLSIDFKDYLKLAEKYKLYFRHIKTQAMNFTKRSSDAKKKRLEIFSTKNISDIKKIFK